MAKIGYGTGFQVTKAVQKKVKKGPLQVYEFSTEGIMTGKLGISTATIRRLEEMSRTGERFSANEVDWIVKNDKGHMNTYPDDRFPFIVAGAKEKYVFLVPIDGEKMGTVIKAFDTFNFYGVGSACGHGNERIIDSVTEVMTNGALAAASFLHPYKAQLCDMLFGNAAQGENGAGQAGISGVFKDLLPGYKVYLLNSGSEANDAALKLVIEYHNAKRQLDNKDVIIAMSNGFHGRTGYAINLNDKDYAIWKFPKIDKKVVFIKYGDTKQLEAAFKENAGKVLSVHFEPVQGESGIILPKPGFIRRIRQLCDANDALMVADEVQTFARTGRWFASEVDGRPADIMITGKNISAGLGPVTVVYARPGAEFGPHHHGNTYTGNPVACTLVMETIKHIHENNLLENSRKSGAYIVRQLQKELGGNKKVAEIRGIGSMVGVQLKVSKGNVDAFALKVAIEAMNDGLLVTTAGVGTLRMLLPLSLTTQEADLIVSKLSSALRRVA
ncbi:aspartate aminotransferase family protein [Candidatus Parvarchaeota archaeon]|nr:aspartate aminotransferase family protein [Candidatus Parvarchaeota archaeon]